MLQLLSVALPKSVLQCKTACPSAVSLLFSIERRAVLCHAELYCVMPSCIVSDQDSAVP